MANVKCSFVKAHRTVADITAQEIPKPLNWQDFQRQCVPLFRHLIGDRHLQEWGREGQAQNGIDLRGCRDGDINKPVGVQCRRYKQPLSAKAMRDESGASSDGALAAMTISASSAKGPSLTVTLLPLRFAQRMALGSMSRAHCAPAET